MKEKSTQALKKIINLPNPKEKIAFRQSISKKRKIMVNSLKPNECLLCGKINKGFCNSHTIPCLSLKNISESGMVVASSYLVGDDSLDDELGMKKAGTIHVICNRCDAMYFQEYENEQNLKSYPSDIMLAQIALKNFLLELVRRREEKYSFQKLRLDSNMTKALYIKTTSLSSENLNKALEKIKDFHNSFDYDIEDFLDEIFLHKNAIEEKNRGGYEVIFYELLPYKTPITFQGSLTLIRDMYGYPVNNTEDYSKKNRIQKLHLAILPLRESTVVLAFYHKKDKKYKSLKSQFNSNSRLKKLEFINYLVFAYTENYYFSPQIKEKIRTDEKLVALSQELFGRPNLGYEMGNDFQEYQRVKPDEIPNFLLEEWSLQ